MAERQAKIETTKAGEKLRRHLYAAQLNLAQQAWDAGNVDRVLELLNLHRPQEDQEDLRGFEWFCLWKLCERSLTTPTLDSGQALFEVAFSPDGRTLASAGRYWAGQEGQSQSRLQLWDVASRKVKPGPGFVSAALWCLAYSEDGKKLASGATGVIQLWDMTTNQLEAAMQGHSGLITHLRFSHDGKLLVSATLGKTIKIWNVETRKILHTLTNSCNASSRKCVDGR